MAQPTQNILVYRQIVQTNQPLLMKNVYQRNNLMLPLKIFAKKMKLLVIFEFITKYFFNLTQLSVLIFLTLSPMVKSQQRHLITSHENIRSVQAYKKGWPLSYPVIQLGSNDILVVSFDELALDVRNLYYSFEHCNADWQPSQLMEMDFLKGYNLFQVSDYQYGFNTTFDYIHYLVEIPSAEAGLLQSGNYRVNFHDGPDNQNPILSVPFFVYEPLVTIVPRIKYTSSQDYTMMQEVDFAVQHPGLTISNPQTEVKVVVTQNGRLDNRITHLKPLFVRHNELVFDYSAENAFEGGNEFRWLDIRSIRFWPQQVREVKFFDPYYHFILQPDAWGDNLSYLYREDFNGKYYLQRKEGGDANTEADYVYVHFSLPMRQPFQEGDIYIMGALTQWQFNESSRMKYNPQSSSYEGTLLLKQGFYNYQYALLPRGKQKATVIPLENSFGQTENDYTIMVYYRGYNDRHDRLVGVAIANSLKNTSALPF